MSIESLQDLEHQAYLNFNFIKNECDNKVEIARDQWLASMKALTDAQREQERNEIRESLRAELTQSQGGKV